MASKAKAVYCKRRGRNVTERVIRADKALGHLMPKGAETFEYKGQLVVCQDRKYNRLLHQRAKALEESGDANKVKCHLCCEYDLLDNLYVGKNSARYHKECHYLYCKEHYGLVSKVTKLYCQKGHWKDGIRNGRRYCKQCTNEYFKEWIKRNRRHVKSKVQGT